MKPSFLSSTLSLAFILCVVSVLAMVFLHVEPSEKLLNVISGVVGAYIGSRIPSSTTPEHSEIEENIIKKEDDVQQG